MTLSLVVRSGVAWLTSDEIETAGALHAFSTRSGGVSPDPYTSLNLGFGVMDPEANVRTNWERFTRSAGMEGMPVARLDQVHSDKVVLVKQRPNPGVSFVGKGDALVTELPGVALAVTSADCVPLLLAVPGRAVAAVHIGWRGVVAGILRATIEVLARTVRGLDFTSIHACLGPHIRTCCFEVGPDVVEKLQGVGLDSADVVHPAQDGGKPHVDLSAALIRQATQAGLLGAQMGVSHLCTRCRQDLFYSYRRDGPDRGMLGTVIALPTSR